MKTHSRILFIFLFLSFGLHLFAGKSSLPQKYRMWDNLSNEDLIQKGRNYVKRSQNDSALLVFTFVGNRYDPKMSLQEIENSAKAINNAGCLYYYVYYDFPQAYDTFINALDICERHQLTSTLGIIYVNLGNLLNEYGRRYYSSVIAQKAVEMYKKGFDYSYKTANWQSFASAFINMTELNYGMKVDDYKALFAKNVPDSLPDVLFARHQYLAIQHIAGKQYAEARREFMRQISVMKHNWEANRYLISTYIGISYVYKLEKKYSQSIDYLKKAEQVASVNQSIDMKVQIYKMLSEIYALQGNDEQSRHYKVVYLESKDSVMNINRLGSIGEMDLIHDLKKEEKKVMELAMKRQVQNYIIIMAVILLLMGCVFIYIVIKKNKELSVRNKSLFLKNQQLMHIEDEERLLRKSYEEKWIEQLDDNTAIEKYSKSSLNDADKESLIYRIEEVMNDTQIICQSDFTISKLAKQVNSNTTYVSQVINEKYGKTFSILLGNHRVKEACRRMNDQENYGNMTIEAISESVGFKSRVTFLNSFKRSIGLTPSEYMRLARQKMNEDC
ncbi:MAG: helix-turn-helix domain-containing protein [Prevotella sp.]|nr:helix-turn-helix domain-containing protein [Prevotella sp.]MDY2634210.1 helix-turn-helix domain-containing protein [Prevotella sp.]